jgi:hypothetical protein
MKVDINELNVMQTRHWVLLEYKGVQKKFYGCCNDTVRDFVFGSIGRIFNFEVSVIDSSDDLELLQTLKDGDEHDWVRKSFEEDYRRGKNMYCPEVGHANFFIAKFWRNTIDESSQ